MNTNQEFNNEKGISNEFESKISGISTHKGVNLTIRALIAFVLILILMIPMAFIGELVRERSYRQEEVKREVSSKWATDQRLTGPILIIPYKGDPVKDKEGKIIEYETDNLYILPNNLNIKGIITPHTRHRSIFDVTVYQSELNISGNFDSLDIKKLQIPAENLYLKDAQLYFGLDDFRGLEEQLRIKWGNDILEFTAGTLNPAFVKNGLYAPVTITTEDIGRRIDFSMNAKIRGSEELLFTPIGKTNSTHISSTWANPSFTGNFIPNNPADITQEGFEADWSILYLNRNYPQVWKDTRYDTEDSQYGVCLLQSVDSYAKTFRAQKYAILFIALTFALYFFIEILQRRKVHPVQYVLVGIALCLFYVLLLSVSEYLNFNIAYVVAALATIVLITLYTKSAFVKWGVAMLFGTVLSTLYLFIFILIQLEDKALLFGSVGLFAVLAIVMYYSRKIEWYGQSN